MTNKDEIVLGKEHYDKILEEHTTFLNICEHARQSARVPEQQKQFIIESMAFRYGFLQVKDLWVSAIPKTIGMKDENGKPVIKFILPDEVYDLIEEYHNPRPNATAN